MKLWSWFGAATLLAGAAGLVTLPTLAQEKGGDKLEWKAFEKGKTFFQELTTVTDQKMKVMGQEVTQKQEQTFVLSYTGDEPTKEGKLVVTQEIKGVKMSIDIGGVKITFDSNDEKQPNNPMTDFFKKLLEAKLKLTINPKDMSVDSIDGNDALVEKLGDTNPQMKPLLKQILNKDALKQMAEPTWAAFPTGDAAKDLKKGSTWKKESNLNLGPIGTYKTEYTYTYEGLEKNQDKIKIDAKLTYTAPQDKGGLPFQIKRAELASKDGTGSALFDRAKGRFENSTMKMTLEGKLMIEVGGMETEVELNQTQTATVRSMDTDPLPKKK